MLADETGVGRLIEVDDTAKLFTKPSDPAPKITSPDVLADRFVILSGGAKRRSRRTGVLRQS